VGLICKAIYNHEKLMTKKPKSTKIMTYLSYEKLFGNVRKGSLVVPISYINDEKNIDSLVSDIIDDFNSVEAISYSSFLNAIVQSCRAEEVLEKGIKDMKASKLIHNSSVDGILFHRDNLLYFISQIIQKSKKGTVKITGPENIVNSRAYYKSLLLINSKLNRSESNFLKDYFIRAYPYYYSPEASYTIYSTRMQRYWYIYNIISKNLEKKKKDKICRAIKTMEQKIGISLKDYFHIAGQVIVWFLKIPLMRQSCNDKRLQHLGFNYKDIETFYINKKRFRGNSAFIKLIEHFSVDLNEIKKKLSSNNRRDKIRGFYSHFQNFFDNPIFKINKTDFCIIDLKFLFEGMCSGFMWHLSNLSTNRLEEIKEQYGYLLEEYFIFLLKKIFSNIIVTNKKESEPDAVLELDDYIIIFEFTTEYYRFASLYNNKTDLFIEDLHRLLFNEGRNDPLARGKTDKGKLFKLEKYVERYKNKNKKVIPILVTENYIGDYDLINEFNRFIDNHPKSKQLKNLKKYKPLIINLDDLEIFWAFSKLNEAGQRLIEYIKSWEKSKKGLFHYNFSYFMWNENNGEVKNKEYNKFFNFSSFLKQTKNT